jgi:hypothetical protein
MILPAHYRVNLQRKTVYTPLPIRFRPSGAGKEPFAGRLPFLYAAQGTTHQTHFRLRQKAPDSVQISKDCDGSVMGERQKNCEATVDKRLFVG